MTVTYPTYYTVERDLSILSMEAFSLRPVVESLKQIVPNVQNVVEGLRDRFTEDSELAIRINQVSRDLPGLSKLLASRNIVDFDRTLVVVPSGFQGNLIKYLEWLDVQMLAVARIATKNMEDFNVYLAVFLSDKQAKLSTRDCVHEFQQSEKTTRKISEELKTLWLRAPNPDSNRQTMTSTIPRFTEVPDLVKAVRKLDSSCTQVGFRNINKGLDKLVERMKLVQDQLATMSDTQLSGEAAVNVGQAAYVLARQLEFLAVMRYNAESAMSCALGLVEQLDRLTKD